MKLKQALIAMSIISSLLLSSASSADSHNDDGPKFSQIKLSENLYMLSGKGGNLAVSTGADGLLLIDDDYLDMVDKTRAAIKAISDEPIKFLINTHWHFDHTGGNKMIGDSGTIIVAHDNVRERLLNGGAIKAFNMTIEPAKKQALPVVTFSDSVSFHWNNDTIDVVHPSSSAHTDGDAVIFFKNDNVLHMGDLYFNDIYPFIDASSGGSMKGVIESVTMLIDKIDNETRVIPGHGALSNKAELIEYRDMLEAVYKQILALKTSGKTLEQVLEAKPSAEFDEKWGGGFLKADAWVGILYSAI
ncbi:MAG: glyoxylase-like metal-dependent hydrolase (beta-lactamase superfamily II) [Alphaproteobacteria bacterium]|jgi:glyoxylase-like metal-dependent hydrolase (beta-lactamase superfamily II)